MHKITKTLQDFRQICRSVSNGREANGESGLLCVMLVKTIEIYGLQQVCIVAVYLWSISELESYLNAEHQP